MAQPTTARFGAYIVSLGNGATPEVFAAPCGFNSKSVSFSRNFTEVDIPDCDDPDAATWVARDLQNMSCTINGSGLLAAEAVPAWVALLDATLPTNAEVESEFSTGILSHTGAFHLGSFETSAENKGRVQVSVSLVSDGEVVTTWTPT